MKALVRWSLAVMLPVGRARASALSTPDGGHRFYSNEAAAAEPLQRIADFGPNPTGTKMYLYVPANVSTSPGAPAVVVALHYCGGTAQAYYTGTPYARLADQKGFLVVYPESPYEGTCWDVSSRAALTHNDDGSDTAAIAAMVTYAMDNYGADAKRVFVTGSSSGAMMTNVMAAVYPELFAAAIAYSGVAAGCFYSQAGGVDQWNSSCSMGQVHGTPQQWAQMVYDMDPKYKGSRPKMQIYHGSADATLLPANYNETIKQWCGVLGFDPALPDRTEADTPERAYTTYTWGNRLVGVYAEGVGHTVPVHGEEDMKFFGL